MHTYLYELAQDFNRFYESNKVIGSDEEKARVTLVGIYADTLQKWTQPPRHPRPRTDVEP